MLKPLPTMTELDPLLIAEDCDDDFLLFRRAARAARIENPICRFRDGEELVEFIKKLEEAPARESPILTFVDLAMPGMSGFDVLEWLKHSCSRQRFLTVVLTGSSRAEDMTKAYALGAEEYLVKPLTPMLLAALAVRPLAMTAG